MGLVASERIIKSPLRYPGGKGFFADYFSQLMSKNLIEDCRYYEPFAGGSGVALGLLSLNKASEVFLNDADYHVYCFWMAVLDEHERFIERMENSILSIKEWHKQKEVYVCPENSTVFEVGFSSFYLNRCNRSGILKGAGPIGGLKQHGKWRLDARFNKSELIERITAIGKLRDRITFRNMDAIQFLKKYIPKGRQRKKTFVYLDPPYVSAGDRLYLNFYEKSDHEKLASYLLEQSNLNWVLTYDDCSIIRKLYSSCQRELFHLRYSLQSRRRGRELLIAPVRLQLSDDTTALTNRWNFVRKLRRN
jgi:DNA adenine methylase